MKKMFNANFQIVKQLFAEIDLAYTETLDAAHKIAKEWDADTIRERGEFVPDYDENGRLRGDKNDYSFKQEKCKNHFIYE